ncbi:hypothetical protein Tco_0889179 [Tanacetum coccineum]
MIPFSEDSLSIISTRIGTSLMLDSYESDMCIQSWDRSSYVRAMIKLLADGELKDTIVVAMPKVFGEGFNLCIIRVEYERKPPKQATIGVLVGQNVSFKSTKQICIPFSNKNSASTNGKKKQAKVSREITLILDGKLKFVDDDENPLVPMGNVDSDSESEVEVVFDEAANLMASTSFKGRSDKGYGTNSLLEQWRETKRDDDYDPYDKDLYESHDMSDQL